jgi:hypothetical protein
MHRARLSLRYYRGERREAIRQYVGRHWAEEGTREVVPCNLLSLYVSVVSRNLIAKNPRVLLSVFQREYKSVVSAMMSWANREIERTEVANTLQRVVLDALFSIGVCKVGLATPAESAAMAWHLPAGLPFASRVDLDDFVYDVHARDFSEVSFIGHSYRVPLDVVRESSIYGKGRKDLQATYDPLYDEFGEERVNVLGRGMYTGNSEEFEDHVDLWEVYLPRHRLVLTLANDYLTGGAEAGSGVDEALRYQRWLGPEHGPYHILGYSTVPGNAMPKGPIQDLIDLHEGANQIFRKLLRQAERQKDITLVSGGADADGNRMVNTSDGEVVRVDNPERLKQVSVGGPNQGNFAFFNVVKDLFSWLAGNLDIMGGLSPQSKTAHQDAMLNENSSRMISDLQDRTVAFTSKVVSSLCWYWHHDPFKVMRTSDSVPGLPGMEIPRELTPGQRARVRFEDMDIRVDPYSLQHSTPQSRMAALQEVMTSLVIPMMPLLQQQNISIDINALLQKVAAYRDMPDLQDVVTITEPPQSQSGPGEQEGAGPTGAKPATTTRNYVRENRPGRTEQGDNMNLANSLMGVNPGGSHPAPAGSIQ